MNKWIVRYSSQANCLLHEATEPFNMNAACSSSKLFICLFNVSTVYYIAPELWQDSDSSRKGPLQYSKRHEDSLPAGWMGFMSDTLSSGLMEGWGKAPGEGKRNAWPCSLKRSTVLDRSHSWHACEDTTTTLFSLFGSKGRNNGNPYMTQSLVP